MDSVAVVLEMVRLGLLEIRPNGEIWKSVIRDRGGHLKPITPRRAEVRLKSGYLGVKVEWQGKSYLALAHRVVWSHLRGPIPEAMTINHRNGVKTENTPENMELLTQGANNLHAYQTGLKQPAIRPILAEIAPEAKRLRAEGKTFAEIGRLLGVAQTTAFNAVNLK